MEIKVNEPAKNDFEARREYATAFKTWLNEVKDCQFDYVAAVTRRGPNIIELILNSEGLSPIAQHMTTDNGLLVQAEDIASYYVANKRFPSIAVLDDLLVHGRSLNQFLTTLQALLLECVRQMEDAVDERQCEDSFYKSLTIWIFAINDAPFCLKQEYQWRLRYQHIWPESKWRELSSVTANFIWEEDIANTAYILSAKTKEAQEYRNRTQESNSWIFDKSARYRDGEQDFCLLSDACPYGIYPTVRSYLRKGYRYYTPYFFVRKLEPDRVTLALKKVFEFMEEVDNGTASELIRLFNRIGKYPRRLGVYCQLFYLLLSQITLRVFISENLTLQGIDNLESDSKKIERNFGVFKDNDHLLECLYKLPWTKAQLLELIELLSSTEDESDCPPQHESSWINDDILKAIELKVYVQALTHEESARDFNQKHGVDGDYTAEAQKLRTGEKELFEILTEVRKELNISPKDIRATTVMLSYITQMMDCGDVSLKARAEKSEDGKLFFYSALRNTEMSLSILPRQISDVFTDFFRVAQFYWRDDDFPQRVKCFFENNMLVNKPADAQKRYVENTVRFAELICAHNSIADSMLNWRSVFG